MDTLLRAAAVIGLSAAFLVLQTPGASALSCVEPAEWYPDAEQVFVGRIADVDGSRIAFEVQEVWQGEDLAELVWLQRARGLDMWYLFSSGGEVEDGYSSQVEYVVAAQDDLVVSPCGLAPADGSSYGVPGAEDPRAPSSGGEEGRTAAGGVETDPAPSRAALATGGAGLLGLGALVGLLRWRRRS
jgi:hypothetical protein